MLLNVKANRFVAMAVRHYIAVLTTALGHCSDDESASLGNDIAYYTAILTSMERAASAHEQAALPFPCNCAACPHPRYCAENFSKCPA